MQQYSHNQRVIFALQKFAEMGISPSDLGRDLREGTEKQAAGPAAAISGLGKLLMGWEGYNILSDLGRWGIRQVPRVADLAIGLPLAAGVGAGALGGVGLYHMGRDPVAWEEEIDKLKYDRVRNEYRHAIRKLKRRKKSPIDGIELEFN